MNHNLRHKILAAMTFAAVISIKLPYESGQRFVVVQGYNSPPTHIKKDLYAIDFSQDGCDAYGKLAVAANAGTVMLAQESGYNGGYGTQVLIKNENNIVARYAHMIPGTIPVAEGDTVVQGEPLGEIGDTGLVAGAACPIHPGTHIHFAMYGENADGSFSPFLPEPISNYIGITAGRWYLSDNAIAITTVPGATAIIERAMQSVLGTGAEISVGNTTTTSVAPVAIATPTATATATATAPIAVTMAASGTGQIVQPSAPISGGGGIGSFAPIGGASVSPPESTTPLAPAPAAASSSSPPDSPPASLPAPSLPPPPPPAPTISITNATFNSSTLAIDLAWQAPQSPATSSSPTSGPPIYQIYLNTTSTSASSTLIATTTATNFSYQLADSDFGTAPQFTVALMADDTSSSDDVATGAASDTTITVAPGVSAPIAVPNWETAIQPIDDTNSNPSWYSDNWYQLGTGFYGTIRALTFEGFINYDDYFASQLYLEEYLDANYTQLNQTYTISNNAPFTNGLKKVTISGLDIPLQPNKYYRLRTYQTFQNRSVILAGTSATGSAMWNEFIYGVGRVNNYYSFYPYISALMIPNYPPLQPPNQIASLAISFDPFDMLINLSWPATTDPDTASSLLSYQINVASSTSSGGGTPTLNDAAWQSVGGALTTSLPVVFGNSYTVGVRAMDDLGNASPVLTQSWNFPAGYTPTPEQIDHSVAIGGFGGAEEIAFNATTTVSGIEMWVGGGFGPYVRSDTAVSIHQNDGGNVGDVIATSNTVRAGPEQGPLARLYEFPAPTTLSPGLYWFSMDDPSHLNGVAVFGSAGDTYPYGVWSDAPTQDAYFRIQEADVGQ